MILQDEGRLSIDDPVSKYIPAFEAVTLRDGKPKQRITLRHCLTHTAGLGGSQQNAGTLQETVERLAQQPLGFEPGTKWQYSPGLHPTQWDGYFDEATVISRTMLSAPGPRCWLR